VDGAAYVVVTPVSCTAQNATLRLPYTDGYTPNPNDQASVNKLISTLSLFDKAQQMRGTNYGKGGVTQMSDTQRSQDTATIRGFHYRDASRGMNLAEDMNGILPSAGVQPGGTTPVGYSTVFPVSMSRGAAFDLDLEYAIGEAIGDEMMAANETLLLAPCMNILRHPLWGRAQETYGEDSFHIGRLASAMTEGVQQHIAANAKHFMAYDIEASRDYNNMTLDEQTMREIYGRHFRMVVQDGGVASVMASYNRVNGEKSTVNHHTLTDVLRTDFGFQGFVLSDWWAFDPQTDTGRPVTYYSANAVQGVKAGTDVELPWSLNYFTLESIVQTGGGLTQADIDTAATRMLMQKLRFNAYDLSKGTYGLGVPKTTYANNRIVYSGCDGHVDLSRKAAVESMVLLKNNNKTLPISHSLSKVAVLGVTVPYKSKNNGKITSTLVDFAQEIRTGDMGSSRAFADPSTVIGPFDGIRNTAPAGVSVVTSGAAIDSVSAAQNIGSDSAVSSADFVIVIAGLTAEDEGEDYTLASDRKSFALDAKQQDARYANIQNTLIASAVKLGKPMVVVLEGGSIIDLPWLDQVPAVVMAWYPGMVGGEAMGMLLWGEYQGTTYNFSGKLPFTWGQLNQYPAFQGSNGTTNADYYLGYRYFDTNNETPVFEFGYGLSYTTFTYDNLQIGCADMSEGAVLPVYVDVTNAGDVPGDEVVMLFVSFPNSKAARRTTIKELKGFARVSLAPGETKQVSIPVRLKDLDYYDQDKQAWVVEDGDITIKVGGSSTHLPKTGTVTVRGYQKASSNY
jgi:beta-glucosidase